MKKIILIVLFGLNFFLSVAFFRGTALGREIDPLYAIITVIGSIIFGVWLYLIRKKEKS